MLVFHLALLLCLLLLCSLAPGVQARVEAPENTPRQTVFTAGLNPRYGGFQMGAPTPSGLSESAWENWFFKHRFALCRRFLDRLAAYPPANGPAPTRRLPQRAPSRRSRR